jgi:hypothetical protein
MVVQGRRRPPASQPGGGQPHRPRRRAPPPFIPAPLLCGPHSCRTASPPNSQRWQRSPPATHMRQLDSRAVHRSHSV